MVSVCTWLEPDQQLYEMNDMSLWGMHHLLCSPKSLARSADAILLTTHLTSPKLFVNQTTSTTLAIADVLACSSACCAVEDIF